jgi:hypothetical protein
MLDFVSMQMCESIDGPKVVKVGKYIVSNLFSERHYPHCSCLAYKYSKRTINFGGHMMPPICKHIKQAQDNVCGWHQQYSSESQDQEGICPRCRGETVSVLVGV